MGKKSGFPKFKEMSKLVITTGLDDDMGQVLEIAPTMKNITQGGKRYFRLDQTCRQFPDGSWAAVYLWDGYGEELLRRSKAASGQDDQGH